MKARIFAEVVLFITAFLIVNGLGYLLERDPAHLAAWIALGIALGTIPAKK